MARRDGSLSGGGVGGSGAARADVAWLDKERQCLSERRAVWGRRGGDRAGRGGGGSGADGPAAHPAPHPAESGGQSESLPQSPGAVPPPWLSVPSSLHSI